MEAAVRVAEQIFGAGSPALVGSLAQLGRFYLLTDRVTNATEVMERITGLLGKNPPEQSPGFLSYLRFRAMLDADLHDLDNAEATFKRAIGLARKYNGQNAVDVAVAQSNLAAAYLKAKRFDEAINQFNEALAILQTQLGEHALVVGYVQAAAAAAYAGKGDQATSAKVAVVSD
jgi:tetratricopeptide (TPR) repeat protein